MRILVVLSAPSTKISPLTPAVRELLMASDLPIPTDNFEYEAKFREVLSSFVKPAHEMYEHLYPQLERRLKEFSERGHEVHLYYISPRYGLVEASQPIVPHAPPQGWGRKRTSRQLANKLLVFEELSALIRRLAPSLVILVLMPSDLPLIHDPPRGRDLRRLAPLTRIVVVSPLSAAKALRGVEGIEVVEARGPHGRIRGLLKVLEQFSQRSLVEFLS